MIGLNIQFLPEVDSTNNYIAKMISEGKVQHGTVILADRQTNGRGQRGNSWQTNSRNQFTASFYLETAFLSVRHAVYLNKSLTLGVARTVSSLIDKKTQIKWPNDILVNDQKLGGILIEGNINNQVLEHVIFGLGINLEQENNLPSSTSLEKLGVNMKPFEFLTHLLPRLQEAFEHCQKGFFGQIQHDYTSQLWRLNEPQVLHDAEGNAFKGEIVGVDDEGSVLIQTQGTVQSYGLQEVKFTY